MKHMTIDFYPEGKVSLLGKIYHYKDERMCLGVIKIRDQEITAGEITISFGHDIQAMEKFCEIHQIPITDQRPQQDSESNAALYGMDTEHYLPANF